MRLNGLSADHWAQFCWLIVFLCYSSIELVDRIGEFSCFDWFFTVISILMGSVLDVLSC